MRGLTIGLGTLLAALWISTGLYFVAGVHMAGQAALGIATVIVGVAPFALVCALLAMIVHRVRRYILLHR